MVPIGIVVPVALLWCVLVVLTLRRFGVRLSFGLLARGGARAGVRLTAAQYAILAGVVMWGFGLVLAITLNDYICWKLWPGEYPALRLQDFVLRCIVCPAIGGVLALFLRHRYASRR